MRALTDRDDRKINSVNAALGAILAISPLLLGYASAAEATWTAVIGGIVITAVAVAALSHMFEWEEWVNLVAGSVLPLPHGSSVSLRRPPPYGPSSR